MNISKMISPFKLLLMFLLLVQVSYAQNIDNKALDSYFDSLAVYNKFMGNVAVSKGGKLIYSRSVGFADVENQVKADESTKYRIGSISKTFTATLVLKAVEMGKLTLDQTIHSYFPSIPNADRITIRQLLSHRSGIHNFTDDASYQTWYTQPKSETEMIQIIVDGNSDFEPDTKMQYSNSNYVLLTYILEKEFEKPYKDLLLENIVQPLSLKNTYYGAKIDFTNHESKSYQYVGAWNLQSETDMSIPLGAGGVVSTAVDLTKFSNALFNGKLLKPESVEIMKTLKDNFGLGLIGIPFYDNRGYGHGGGIDGFRSMLVHFEDGDVSYAMASNGLNYNSNEITKFVLAVVFDKPYEIPSFSMSKSTYKPDLALFEQYLGIYSVESFPLKITITLANGVLYAQATGQSAFPLEPTAEDKFKFTDAGIVIEFNRQEHQLLIKQGGRDHLLTKE